MLDVDFTISYAYARDTFEEWPLEDIPKYTGYEVENNHVFVDWLDQKFALQYPSAQVIAHPETEPRLQVYTQIIMLHYMTQRSEVKETGKWISFGDLPSYFINKKDFYKYDIHPLEHFFGYDHKALLEASLPIGGKEIKIGDELAVAYRPLPRVPVAFLVRKSDKGEPEAEIFYDESVVELLKTQDCHFLAKSIIDRLEKHIKK